MKIKVSRAALLKEIQMLGGILNNTNTLPNLDNYLFNINKKIFYYFSKY